LYGGRWSSPGIRIVYTSSSLSLAIIETRVHLKTPPLDYVRLTIEIPDASFTPVDISDASLGSGWRNNLSITRAAGDSHFATQKLVPLRVPSVVADIEWNLLFHPEWAAAVHVTIVEIVPIDMDPRMWS
jgi:RES domain-containing protein